MTAYEHALQWKREQEAQGIFVTDEDFQQTLNAITYEIQHRHDYDERDNDPATSE